MKAKYLISEHHNGYRGIVRDIEEYEKLKRGEVNWKDHIRVNLKTIAIPAELFFKFMDQDKRLDSETESLTNPESSKCAFSDGIVIKPDGENELDPCLYKTKEIHRNVTVKVSECVRCGSVDISWEAQDNTESEYMEE